MPLVHAAPQDEGSWSPVIDWPTIAIHSVLTPQGKVMNFGTDQSGLHGAQFFYDVWDPDRGFGEDSHNTLTSTLGVNSFCSAAVVMPETGNILMAGGDNHPNGFPLRGISDAPIFNTQTDSLSSAPNMSSARWYPTSTVLASGEVLLSGGHNEAYQAVVTPEIYSTATNQWRSLLGINTSGYSPFYPRHWVTSDGRIFGFTDNKKMYYMNLNGNGSLENLGTLNVSGSPYSSTAVMYQPGKILHLGEPGAEVIDINGAIPSARSVTRPSETGRTWVNSVVLPNGKVFIVGGSSLNNDLASASYRPEIWDPATENWSLMVPSVKARLYHSTALLLKDGRILVAGGGAPGPQLNANAEVFSPPYLFNSLGQAASRPVIMSAPNEAPYGSKITVQHSGSQNITRATLIKTGAVTHSFNMEQRFIELDFQDVSNGVSVTIPNSPNLATPGYYLLHLLDDKGIPSKAHIIRISSTATSPVEIAPVAKQDNIVVTSPNLVTINPLSNDTGTGLVLQAPSLWSWKGGKVSLTNNQLSYTPKPGFNGEDKIWYTIKDSQARSSWSVIIINVSGNNSVVDILPVANQDNVAVTSPNQVTINPLGNDTGTGLVLQAPNLWSWKGGQVALVNNQLRYTPKPGFNGEDKIWYNMKDSQGRSGWSVININVSGNNSVIDIPPVANQDNVSVTSPNQVTINPLANDTGTGLVLQAPNLWSWKGGQVALVSNQLRYTPKSGFNGEDKIWYSMKDSQGRSGWSVIVINVNVSTVSAPFPIANADGYTVASNSTRTLNILNNDTPSGLTIDTLYQYTSKGGTTTSINSRDVSYTPKAGFTGVDDFWYVVVDSQGRKNSAKVTITVTP